VALTRIVVIGASAGGISALKEVVAGLDRNFPAPVLVVTHLSSNHKSLLPDILTRAGDLPAQEALTGQDPAPGRIYTAAPGFHLLVRGSKLLLSSGPKENGFRPSVDALFRSAALEVGPGAIGVVLSGSLDDGASGLYAIKQMGGLAIVQSPADAEYDSMPLRAISAAKPDEQLSARHIGLRLNELIRQPIAARVGVAEEFLRQMKMEVDISASDSAFEFGIMEYGEPTRYTCPSCHGVLFKIQEGPLYRFRCHTGHGFSLPSLLHEQRIHLEDILWQSVMTLQESIALFNDSAERLANAGDEVGATDLREKAAEAKRKADALRELALSEPRARPQVDREGYDEK